MSLVVREDSPWALLCDQIIDQRGRLEIKAADLEGRGLAHPMYKMVAILIKAGGAVDWFNGAPLGTVFGDAYHLHSHHIFPQALLYRTGYDRENHLHRKVVNEIANRAFLTADSNLKLADRAPDAYLPNIEEKYPSALVKQLIPISPELWTTDRYAGFLAARRDLIAKKINEFMDSLVTEPEQHVALSADQLRRLGESATLEFKSTLRWDLIQNRVNKNLEHSVLKTIAAFLNSNGGTLLIGIEDSGNVLGLKNDMKTVRKQDRDGFEQTLMNLVVSRIGAEFAALVVPHFEEIDGETVCVVEVDQGSGPAYVETDRGKQFFVRAGNTTRPLDPEETVKYVESHLQ